MNMFSKSLTYDRNFGQHGPNLAQLDPILAPRWGQLGPKMAHMEAKLGPKSTKNWFQNDVKNKSKKIVKK